MPAGSAAPASLVTTAGVVEIVEMDLASAGHRLGLSRWGNGVDLAVPIRALESISQAENGCGESDPPAGPELEVLPPAIFALWPLDNCIATDIENGNNGQFTGIFDCGGPVPTRGLAATRRHVLGAVLVHQLTLLLRRARHEDLRVGLEPFLKAA